MIYECDDFLVPLVCTGHKGSMELRRGGSGNQRVLHTLLLLLLCCTSVERVRCEEVSFVSHGDDLLGVTAVYIDPYPGTDPQNVWGNCPYVSWSVEPGEIVHTCRDQ